MPPMENGQELRQLRDSVRRIEVDLGKLTALVHEFRRQALGDQTFLFEVRDRLQTHLGRHDALDSRMFKIEDWQVAKDTLAWRVVLASLAASVLGSSGVYAFLRFIFE